MDPNNEGLITVLREQLRCAESMLQTLGREHQALVAGNAEELNSASAEKAEIVEALEGLETQRRSLTRAVATSLSALSDEELSPSTLPEWRQLLDLIAECKQQNERNGVLVKARTEQVRIALQALRGAEPGVYGSNGLTPAARDARSIGTA